MMSDPIFELNDNFKSVFRSVICDSICNSIQLLGTLTPERINESESLIAIIFHNIIAVSYSHSKFYVNFANNIQ